MSDNAVRAVLLKPGDVLLIGNAGTLSDEDVKAIGQAAAELRSALGLAHVLVFHEDIDLAVTTPSSTEAEG